jgi:hypothetical protein
MRRGAAGGIRRQGRKRARENGDCTGASMGSRRYHHQDLRRDSNVDAIDSWLQVYPQRIFHIENDAAALNRKQFQKRPEISEHVQFEDESMVLPVPQLGQTQPSLL